MNKHVKWSIKALVLALRLCGCIGCLLWVCVCVWVRRIPELSVNLHTHTHSHFWANMKANGDDVSCVQLSWNAQKEQTCWGFLHIKKDSYTAPNRRPAIVVAWFFYTFYILFTCVCGACCKLAVRTFPLEFASLALAWLRVTVSRSRLKGFAIQDKANSPCPGHVYSGNWPLHK